MKYFFISDANGGTHVIVAASLDRAKHIANTASLFLTDIYELTESTFPDEGFLISSK